MTDKSPKPAGPPQRRNCQRATSRSDPLTTGRIDAMEAEHGKSASGWEEYEHLLGEPLWQIEWITDVPVDEHGDLLVDDATFRQSYFWTREEAMAEARVVLKDDLFGSVAVTPCHLKLYESGMEGFYVEYDGDPEYYEGETDG